MYASIFTDSPECSDNLTVFQELWKQAAVRVSACADLLLAGKGELVTRLVHKLDPGKTIWLHRFRCRPMKRSVRHTSSEKAWFARLQDDMKVQRAREIENPGSGDLLVVACATKAMVLKLGKMFTNIGVEGEVMQSLPMKLIHGDTDEPEIEKLYADPDKYMSGVRFLAFNTKVTVALDFKCTPILRGYAHLTYGGGDIRNVGQGLNRFARPDPQGNSQCADPTIYVYTPGTTFEEHRIKYDKRGPAPRVLSLEGMSATLTAKARKNIQIAPMIRSDGTAVGGSLKRLPDWYIETNPIFELERAVNQSKDYHYLEFANWCYYKRYPLRDMEENNWEPPALYDGAIQNNHLVRRVAESSHMFDIALTFSPEVCANLSCAHTYTCAPRLAFHTHLCL